MCVQKTVNRACILKQAEKIMDEMVNSKAMLEVQYEDEVGGFRHCCHYLCC